MQETRVQSWGWEDPLEKEMATCSRILAWENPMDRGTWHTTVHRVAKSWTQLSVDIEKKKKRVFVYDQGKDIKCI